jgi:tetratricopeptide (TPR) repeat protein
MTRDSGRRLWPIALLALLFALGGVLGLQKIRTFDYWWHLRTGQLIAETGTVPGQDVYTYTVPGHRWIDIHWLFQLGLYGVEALGGHRAVVVAKVLCVWALLAVLAPIGWRRERAWVSALALGLMLLVAGDRFMPRPELPSFVLLAAVLALLDRNERRGGKGLFWIVPIQLLWVNVHGLFALGIAACAIAIAAELLRPVLVPGQSLRRDRLLGLGVVTALAALVSLANPNGLDGALYPLDQLRMVGPANERGFFGSVISELTPSLAGDRGLTGPLLVATAALAGLSFAGMVANWRRVSAFDPLAWVAFGYLALGAQRNVALFAIVAAPIAVRNWNAFLDVHRVPASVGAAAAGLVAVGLGAATVDVARDAWFLRAGTYRETGWEPFEWYYPVGAAEWLARERPPGPIAHHMADGGYLIWRLWPGAKVMADGRLEVFGPEVFADLQIWDVAHFRELDERYHFGSVLVHYSLFEVPDLLRWLYLNPNWRLVQVDDTAALFVRWNEGAARWPQVDVDADDLFPPLPADGSVEERLRLRARVHFYASFQRFDRALALWEDGLARFPDLESGQVVHAYLLERAGYAAAAEAILREELARRPDDASLLAQVGDLRLEAGDREAARALYERALRIDPDHRYAELQRASLAEGEGDLETAAWYYTRVVSSGVPGDPLASLAASRLNRLGEIPQPGAADAPELHLH